MHPSDKFLEPGMRAQGVYGVVGSGKFRFRQGGVDFTVADMVQKYCSSAFSALEFRDQVVLALLDVRWDRAAAQGTDRM